MEAMKIYESLSRPPKEALRTIQAGNLKGKTDINPQWRYKAMTEQFGLVGIGWKYDIQKLWTEPGANGETLAFAQVAVYVRNQDTKEWSDAIVGIGGSKLINKFSKGPESNDEGYKMAVTDAFSTSLKMLGVAADIYAGKWDGSKYSDRNEPAHQQTQPKGPAGGPDTEEERKRINELLSARFPDGTKIFTQKDCAGIGGLRDTNTAVEVIKLINEEIKVRKEAWEKANPKPSQILKQQIAPDMPVEDDPEYYEQNQPELTEAEEKGAFDVF